MFFRVVIKLDRDFGGLVWTCFSKLSLFLKWLITFGSEHFNSPWYFQYRTATFLYSVLSKNQDTCSMSLRWRLSKWSKKWSTIGLKSFWKVKMSLFIMSWDVIEGLHGSEIFWGQILLSVCHYLVKDKSPVELFLAWHSVEIPLAKCEFEQLKSRRKWDGLAALSPLCY